MTSEPKHDVTLSLTCSDLWMFIRGIEDEIRLHQEQVAQLSGKYKAELRQSHLENIEKHRALRDEIESLIYRLSRQEVIDITDEYRNRSQS